MATAVLRSREAMTAASDENTKYVWTDEETSTFFDLMEETNINVVLDGKQQQHCLLAPFN